MDWKLPPDIAQVLEPLSENERQVLVYRLTHEEVRQIEELAMIHLREST